MARRIRDVGHAGFRNFTTQVQIAKRELRELEPEAAPRETSIIFNDAEQKVVMAYLLARKTDQKTGDTTATDAFFRDRQRGRMLKQILARIPVPDDKAVNA